MKNNAGRQSRLGLHPPKTLWISLLLLGLFIGIMFKVMVHETPEDRNEYMRLMSQADPGILGNNPLTPYSVDQNRSGILKDYFYTQGADRLHIRLHSEHASLMMVQGPGGSALIEKMRDVECQMQEGLFYLLKDGREAIKLADGKFILRNSKTEKANPLPPSETLDAVPMQNIHHFQAKEAKFYYQSGQFTGESVRIMHYAAPGHEIPAAISIPSTAMQGTAETIEITLTHGMPNFKATGFKALLSTSGRK